MKNQILSALSAECPWRDTLHWFETVDSTNSQAKAMACSAPEGTVLIASRQTAGRGRMGRSFHSPQGKGLYLSVILKPNCKPEQLMHLTCAAAVAACNAVDQTTGLRPGIKWTNDLVSGTKKLGGILTELSIDSKTGLVSYAVIGIGINCNHKQSDFPPELQDIASSIFQVTGKEASLPALAAALILQLWKMSFSLTEKAAILEAYRTDCVTIGKHVSILRGEEIRYGQAVDIDPEGSLIVRCKDGRLHTVQSGEVSIRGMYGYVE